MKKKIIIFCAAIFTLGLTGFKVIHWNDVNLEKDAKNLTFNTVEPISGPFMDKLNQRIYTDFIYDIGPRFSGVSIESIKNAKSIDAIFHKDDLENMVSLKSVEIIVIKDEKQSNIRVKGNSRVFNKAQLRLLNSFEYSTNFNIRVDFEQINNETGMLEDNYMSPHHTIVPETQAIYSEGKDAFITFLKDKIRNMDTQIDADKLRPAKLYFTISKSGTIENIKVDNPSGYPDVDKMMIELINVLPGTWTPAKNEKDEKVDQELVVSYGLMGC